MRSNTVMRSILVSRLILAFLLLVMLGGCQLPDQTFSGKFTDLYQSVRDSARINGFLTLKQNQGPAIRLEVASIEILADDLWLPLTSGPLTIDSTEIGTGQLFLGGQAILPGRYKRLRMKVTEGALRQAGGEYTVIASEPFMVEIALTDKLDIELEESRCLLLTWDVENSLLPDNSLKPALTASPPLKQLPGDLIYVSCPNIDTIFVVRADKNWVVDSFAVRGGPTYLAIDPNPSSKRLYVLASRERMVKVVDLSSYRGADFFPAPLNDDPTFMTISPDGQWIYLLDERSGYLSRMNPATGQKEARIQVGNRPKYMAYLKGQNLLAVSLSLSQKVLLLDPLNLTIQRTVSTGSSPEGVVASGDQLYIAEYGDNTLSVVDLDGRSNQSQMTAGFGPRRLLATNSQIFVSNYHDGSLSVLLPGQLGVIQEIYGLGRPKEMALNRFYRRLYVADDASAYLSVVDVNTNLLIRRIALGAKPFGLAVVQ
jgi:YVTN family beta-propeller protein